MPLWNVPYFPTFPPPPNIERHKVGTSRSPKPYCDTFWSLCFRIKIATFEMTGFSGVYNCWRVDGGALPNAPAAAKGPGKAMGVGSGAGI